MLPTKTKTQNDLQITVSLTDETVELLTPIAVENNCNFKNEYSHLSDAIIIYMYYNLQINKGLYILHRQLAILSFRFSLKLAVTPPVG